MKKILTAVFVLLSMFLCTNVYAEEPPLNPNIENIMPSEFIEPLKEYGFSEFDTNEILNLDLEDVINYIIDVIKNELSSPITVIYAVFIIAVILSVTLGIGNNYLSFQSEGVSLVGVLAICSTTILPVIDIFNGVESFIKTTSGFIKIFSPCLSGIMAMSGKTLSGAGYNIGLIIASNLLSTFISNIILPLLLVLLCLTIVSRISININLGSVLTFSKSIIIWGLTLTTTLFIAFITIKGRITAGADSLSLRTGKFFLGNFVPAIGGALAEAASSVKSGLGVIRDSVGFFGIIAVALYFIPIVIKVLIYKLSCDISGIICDFMGIENLKNLFKDVSSILNIIIAIILNFSAVFVLTTAAVLSFGG